MNDDDDEKSRAFLMTGIPTLAVVRGVLRGDSQWGFLLGPKVTGSLFPFVPLLVLFHTEIGILSFSLF